MEGTWVEAASTVAMAAVTVAKEATEAKEAEVVVKEAALLGAKKVGERAAGAMVAEAERVVVMVEAVRAVEGLEGAGRAAEDLVVAKQGAVAMEVEATVAAITEVGETVRELKEDSKVVTRVDREVVTAAAAKVECEGATTVASVVVAVKAKVMPGVWRVEVDSSVGEVRSRLEAQVEGVAVGMVGAMGAWSAVVATEAERKADCMAAQMEVAEVAKRVAATVMAVEWEDNEVDCKVAGVAVEQGECLVDVTEVKREKAD